MAFKVIDIKDILRQTISLELKSKETIPKRLLSLSQETFIKKILERFRMNNYKSMDIPTTRGETLSLEICPMTRREKVDMSRVLFSSVVGSLIYVMMCTRSDIYYVIGLISRYQSNSRRDHWKAVKKISRYLK